MDSGDFAAGYPPAAPERQKITMATRYNWRKFEQVAPAGQHENRQAAVRELQGEKISDNQGDRIPSPAPDRADTGGCVLAG